MRAHVHVHNYTKWLYLVSIHSGDLMRLAKHGMRTSLRYHIAQQILLAVVGGENGDLLSGIAQQTHVLIDRHNVLGLQI